MPIFINYVKQGSGTFTINKNFTASPTESSPTMPLLYDFEIFQEN